jgi:hypothetical protein
MSGRSRQNNPPFPLDELTTNRCLRIDFEDGSLLVFKLEPDIAGKTVVSDLE